MAVTFSIAPNPHWVIIDNLSKLPNGAAIFTYRSLNKEEYKPAFEDAAGMHPYSQPIVGFGNGTMPPIYWEFDDAASDELYYIRVYDSADPTTRKFLWDFDGLSGQSGGGGGTITTINNLTNLIANNVFFRHADAVTPVTTFTLLAPSNNAGFVGDLSSVDAPASPDIIFAKSNATATDSISFPDFTDDFLSPTSPTPENYLNYTCSIAGSETYKIIQIPISKGLRNLSGQTLSVSIFSQWNSGENGVTLRFRQFFGNGGPANADVITNIGSLSYSMGAGVWQDFQFTEIVIPSINGLTLGTCGNDGLFLQILIPVSGTKLTNLDFTKPGVFLGNETNIDDYQTYDEIDSIISLPRTGDIRLALNNFTPYGWVPMDDGTIGSASSNATSRKNIDTFPLFNLIWNTFQANTALAPMFESTGVPVVGYGASSFADFNANRQISLTKQAGRVIAGVSGAHLIGTFGGVETYALVANNLPAHVHPATSPGGQFIESGGASTGITPGNANASIVATTGVNVTTNAAFSLIQPTVYQNIFIKL